MISQVVLVLALAMLGVTGTAGADSAAAARCVYTVYYTPADRKPLPGCMERLDRVMTDVQSFYSREMARNGYGPITFPVERDAAGHLVIHLVRGTKTYARGQEVDWDDIWSQVDPVLQAGGIDPKLSHVVVFQNLIFKDGRTVDCWAPYGGLGDHISGRACVTDNVDVDPPNLVRTTPAIYTAGREQPLNEYVMAQLGGVAHELGHSLGLPHNRELPGEKDALGTALMGNGNYTYGGERAGKAHGSFLTRATALILSRHPLFRAGVRDAGKDPMCAIDTLDYRAAEGRLAVRGRVRAAVPIVGLAVYLDPTGGSDYDAWSWLASARGDGSFRFAIGPQKPGYYALRLRFVHANGAQSVFEYPYRLEDTARPPAHWLNREFVYDRRVVPAYDSGDQQRLKDAVRLLEGEGDTWYRKARILEHALARKPGEPGGLASLDSSVRQALLSDVRWESAKVGEGVPARDLLPDSGHVMESGEGVHEHGLRAYAPSAYVFRLGGSWRRFTCACGLQYWFQGTVDFVIRGDGRELYRSGTVSDWKERGVSVDVTGVDCLELIVEPTPDGPWDDNAVWFSPRLER